MEVDGLDDRGPDALDPPGAEPNTSRSRWVLVALGVIAALLLVAALAALQPEDGETAAGTDRGTTSTTNPATTSISPTSTASTTPSGPIVRRLQRSALGPAGTIIEIVSDDLGLFGLAGTVGDRMSLFRSLRGTDWSVVETEFSEAATPVQGRWTQYQNLVAFDDGLAVLRIQEDLTVRNAPLMVDRLVSLDGVFWDVDQSIEAVVATRGSSWLFVHTSDAVGIVTSEGNASLETLLSEVLIEDSGVDPANVCWIEPVGSNQIRTFPCMDEGGVAFNTDITASDLADPTLFPELAACAAAVDHFGPITSVTRLARPGGEVVEFTSRDFAVGHSSLPDGAIAALSLGSLVAGEVSACDSFAGGFPELPEPAIELVSPDGDVSYIRFPEQLRTPSVTETYAPTFASDAGLFLLLDSSVWRVDVETEEWVPVLDLPEPQTEFVDYRFTDAGRLVGVADGRVVIGELGEGTVETFPISEDLGDWAHIVYAGNGIVTLELERNNRVVIELPS